MLKADNEDKQDAIMLADAEDQEDPDDEQLDMQQDDDEPEDSDVEELDNDATDGDDGENNAVQQQDDDDDEDALSKTLQHDLIIASTCMQYSLLIFSITSATGRRYKCSYKRTCRWIRRRWSMHKHYVCIHVLNNS